MTVATLRIDLRLHPCPPPREARRQVRAIVDRLHKSFNVSVAGAEGVGGPDRAVLLAAAAGASRREARETLERVADAVAAHPRAEVLRHEFQEV